MLCGRQSPLLLRPSLNEEPDSPPMATDMTSTDPESTESAVIHPWGEPFRQFEAWYAEAEKSEPNDPNGMALATVGADGMPSVRMVLLKGHDEKGFVFYTNYESRKGRQIL